MNDTEKQRLYAAQKMRTIRSVWARRRSIEVFANGFQSKAARKQSLPERPAKCWQRIASACRFMSRLIHVPRIIDRVVSHHETLQQVWQWGSEIIRNLLLV